MRKTLFLFTAMAMANHAFADGVSDGLGMAGDTFYSYTPYIQTLGFVLTCIIGIVGAFAIYYAIDVSIPGLDDPVWMPDNRFSPIGSFYPINRPGWGTAVVVTPN